MSKEEKQKPKKTWRIIILMLLMIGVGFFIGNTVCLRCLPKPAAVKPQSCGRNETFPDFTSVLNFIVNNKSLTLDDMTKFRQTNPSAFIFPQQNLMTWKGDDGRFIGLPSFSYSLIYNDTAALAGYQKQSDRLFENAGFTVNEKNTYHSSGIADDNFRGYQINSLKCQTFWSSDMASVEYKNGSFQEVASGNSGDYYRFDISCGYLNPDFITEYEIFYNRLNTEKNTNWIVYIDNDNGAFAAGRAGVFNSMTGESWLAQKAAGQWQVIAIQNSEANVRKCTDLNTEVYVKYGVPKEFQNIPCIQ